MIAICAKALKAVAAKTLIKSSNPLNPGDLQVNGTVIPAELRSRPAESVILQPVAVLISSSVGRQGQFSSRSWRSSLQGLAHAIEELPLKSCHMPIRGYLCTGLILLAQAIYCAAFLSANPLGRSPFGPGTKAIRERRGWHCPEQRATQPRGVVRMTGATKLLAMAAPAMVETTYEIAYPEGQQVSFRFACFDSWGA